MLRFFRKKHIAKIIFWGLVILIMPAFVLWGTGNISRPKEKGPRYAGIIDNKKVSFDNLYESITAVRCLLILNYSNRREILDAFLKNKPLVAKISWDRLVMLDEARRQKIKVSDQDVISYIESHPLFLRNGAFDPKVYDYVLRYNMGLAPRNFEEIVRANLEVKKLNDLLTKDVTINDEEVMKEYKREYDKFKISYILIDVKSFIDKTSADDEMAKKYYEEHKEEFTLPFKEGEALKRFSNFEDVKASIKSYLAENEARPLALKNAEETRKKIVELMDNKKDTFEGASSKLGLKATQSPLFSKADYIESLGEASPLADAAVNLKLDEISNPIVMRSGAVIFKVLESKGIDEEKFKKDKEEFSKIALERKKAEALDTWFAEKSFKNRLNIDLQDIEKYSYR